MSAAADYLENKILDHIFGGSDYTRPATLYIALFTSAPTDAGGGTEVSGGSYARAAVTNNSTNFPAAVAGSKSNATALTFAAATGAWGTVTHVAIFDSLTGGNMLFSGALNASKTIQSGDVYSISIGQLVITAS